MNSDITTLIRRAASEDRSTTEAELRADRRARTIRFLSVQLGLSAEQIDVVYDGRTYESYD